MADLLFLGHGPPRVPDNLELWLIALDEPDVQLAAELSATLPEELRAWALDGERCNGSVGWHGRVLHVDSGMDVRYLVKTLDPEHLAWLPEQVSDADIERVLDEVMDGARKGPKAPSVSDWDLFGAMIGQWVESLNQRWPLWMVVVDRKVRPPATARHRHAAAWVAEHLDEVAARHGALLDQSGRAYAAIGWGAPVVAACLADEPKPPESRRNVLLQLLEGSRIDGLPLASKLVGLWPKTKRPGVIARLLREGHELALPLLTAPATHGCLLDDDVYAAAMAPKRLMFPRGLREVVVKRMLSAKLGEQQSEWLRRLLAVSEADGTLRRRADEEPPGHDYHESVLDQWLALTELFDG